MTENSPPSQLESIHGLIDELDRASSYSPRSLLGSENASAVNPDAPDPKSHLMWGEAGVISVLLGESPTSVEQVTAALAAFELKVREELVHPERGSAARTVMLQAIADRFYQLGLLHQANAESSAAYMKIGLSSEAASVAHKETARRSRRDRSSGKSIRQLKRELIKDGVPARIVNQSLGYEYQRNR